MNSQSIHYNYIDYARFIGLFLMVLGHQKLLDSHFTSIIWSFHMPLFFILSGAFHKELGIKTILKKIFKTLLLPFLLIASSFCVLYFFLLLRRNSIDFNYLLNVAGTFLSPGHRWGSLGSYCIYIWFFLALAEIKLIASAFSNKWVLILISFCSVGLFLIIQLFGDKWGGVPLALDSALLAFPFYVIGYVLKPHILSSVVNFKQSTLVIIFCALLMPVLLYYNGNGDINMCKYGHNIILFYLLGTTGSILVIELSRIKCHFWKNSKLCDVTVYGATMIVGYGAYLTGIIKQLNHYSVENNVIGLLIGIVTILLLYPVIVLACKYCPVLLGKYRPN